MFLESLSKKYIMSTSEPKYIKVKKKVAVDARAARLAVLINILGRN